MANLKYSRQREAIKDYLSSTNQHPTADTVYTHVREEFPHISLGTVYRNLNLLADIGEVAKITTPNGGDRFDADISPHYHVLCTKCGKVIDLNMEPLDSIDKRAQTCFDGHIDSHTALFFGTCRDCLENNIKTDVDNSEKIL